MLVFLQFSEAISPLLWQTNTSSMFSYGVSNHEVFGNFSKTENIIGAAILVPVSPGRPSPSAFPTQTTVTYSGVIPIAQASLCPKLVPVFHAIF